MLQHVSASRGQNELATKKDIPVQTAAQLKTIQITVLNPCIEILSKGQIELTMYTNHK
jgi:hypothetical protein